MFATTTCLTVLALAGAAQPYAHQHGLALNSVLAVIAVESQGQPHAFRYEPGYYGLYMAKKPEMRRAAARYGVRNVSASIGLMQTMFALAYEYGFRGNPTQLYDIRTSLKYGTAHLAYLVDRYGEQNAFRAYNQGEGGMRAGRGYSYAAQVLRYKAAFSRRCR